MLVEKRIEIKAVPKPRQTRSDKWNVRPCVARYRAFADELRLKFGPVPDDVQDIHVTFFIQTRKRALSGRYHRQKPDLDNLLKAVMDALFKEDKGISGIECKKIWADYDAISIALY